MAIPEGKKKFEIKSIKGKKSIFIDNELFDYEIDAKSLAKMKDMGPEYYHAAQIDIQKHFLESLSEFLNREVKLKDIAIATNKGYI